MCVVGAHSTKLGHSPCRSLSLPMYDHRPAKVALEFGSFWRRVSCLKKWPSAQKCSDLYSNA